MFYYLHVFLHLNIQYELSDKTMADVSKNIEKITVPITDKSKNMIFDLTTEDNSSSLFSVIDDVKNMYILYVRFRRG